jgi:putative polyhydroxyalkanoate system protein
MSSIHLKHKHALGREETRKRVESIAQDLKKEYNMDYSWDDNRVNFHRKGASGSVQLGDGFIELDIKLGMLLTPLKGKIEETIRRDIKSKLA